MAEEFGRRDFVKQATAAALSAAPAAVSALGQNSRVQVGVIGSGGRGYYLMERMYKGSGSDVTVVSVCDAYTGRLARAKDRVQTMGGNTPKTFADYRELLAEPGLDAVIIATPEHLHYRMTMDALKAGKHIYVEKPLSHTIEEGIEILKAAEKSNKVVQVGTQNRSNSLYINAKEMVAQGLIGDVHYVRAFWYRNSLPNDPAWRYSIPADADEKNTDWGRFLGSAPKRNFDKRRFYQWRLYWDYSGGISTDLLVHQTDITNFVCAKTVPSSCAASGGTYRWVDPDDDRDVPDTLSAIYEYPGRFHINYSCYFGNKFFGYGEQFLGNEGTIEVLNRQTLTFTPENFDAKTPSHIAARQAEKIHIPGNDNNAVEAHVHNWVQSILGKEKPIAPPLIGHQAAISGHLATLSYRNNKKVYWNDATQKYRFA